MPAPITLNSSGFLVLENPPSYPLRGIGQGYPTVVKALPGGSTIARGVGETDFSGVGAPAGSLQVDFVTPGSGDESLAFLVDNPSSPLGFLGVALDSEARPYAIIKDIYGNTVAETTSSAPDGTPGLTMSVVLTWNSAQASASLTINNVLVPQSSWTTYPATAWTPFIPGALQAGYGNVLGLSTFSPSTGLLCVQLAP